MVSNQFATKSCSQRIGRRQHVTRFEARKHEQHTLQQTVEQSITRETESKLRTTLVHNNDWVKNGQQKLLHKTPNTHIPKVRDENKTKFEGKCQSDNTLWEEAQQLSEGRLKSNKTQDVKKQQPRFDSGTEQPNDIRDI